MGWARLPTQRPLNRSRGLPPSPSSDHHQAADDRSAPGQTAQVSQVGIPPPKASPRSAQGKAFDVATHGRGRSRVVWSDRSSLFVAMLRVTRAAPTLRSTWLRATRAKRENKKNLRIGTNFRSGGAPRLLKPIFVAIGLAVELSPAARATDGTLAGVHYAVNDSSAFIHRSREICNFVYNKML
jgi:hypothetical protein